jgi:hypothetical protein
VLGVQVPFAVLLGEVPEPFWAQVWVPSMIGLLILSRWFRSYHDVGRKCWQVLFTWKPSPIVSIWPVSYVKVALRGLLDLFVKAGDNIIVIDTKTSKSDIGDGYDNSAQIMSYMWAMQELARTNPDSGLPTKVHASLINGVIIRPPYKNGSREAKPNDRPRNSFVRTPIEYYSQERLERHRLGHTGVGGDGAGVGGEGSLPTE